MVIKHLNVVAFIYSNRKVWEEFKRSDTQFQTNWFMLSYLKVPIKLFFCIKTVRLLAKASFLKATVTVE